MFKIRNKIIIKISDSRKLLTFNWKFYLIKSRDRMWRKSYSVPPTPTIIFIKVSVGFYSHELSSKKWE